MQWKTHLIIASAAVLAACASPATQPIKVDEAANQAEARLQNELALEGLINDELRLKRIASDIKMKASGLCGELVEYDLGVYALSKDMLPRQFREAANTLYQIGQRPKVLLVYPGSGSEEAGIKNGDEIVSINDWLLPAGEASAKRIIERLQDFLKDGKSLELKVARGSEEISLSVQPRKQCAFPVMLNGSDQLNAFADGKNVFIARGMMRFAQDDTELALVVSHEMAHNSMLHMKAKTSNYVLGTVLDILITATTGVNTQGTFGNMAASRYSQEFEAEADYVGLYMMAVAGKNIDNAPKFWRKMAAAHPTGIEADYSSSHPSTAYRLLALEETVKEIKLKKETGASLNPEMKQPTPATSPGVTLPLQTSAASEAIEGHFSGKASKVAGLTGLLKGIDIKLSFTNKTEKAITRLEGQARLYADDGEEIGSVPFRSEDVIPGTSSIELISTVYPILFSGYHKLRELDDSKVRAEFTFEAIEFADGSKAAK